MACQLDSPEAVADCTGNHEHGQRLARNFDQAGSCVGHSLVHPKARIPAWYKELVLATHTQSSLARRQAPE